MTPLQKCKSLKKLIGNNRVCEGHRQGGGWNIFAASTQIQKHTNTQIKKHPNSRGHKETTARKYTNTWAQKTRSACIDQQSENIYTQIHNLSQIIITLWYIKDWFSFSNICMIFKKTNWPFVIQINSSWNFWHFVFHHLPACTAFTFLRFNTF